MWLPNSARTTVNAEARIQGSTALVGGLGNPVRHSLSPVMHNAALEAMGLDWAYLALPAPAAELATVVRALEAMGCRGLNVTIPHKERVLALADTVSDRAAVMGAANTLTFRDDGVLMADNTDGSPRGARLSREPRCIIFSFFYTSVRALENFGGQKHEVAPHPAIFLVRPKHTKDC